MSLLNTKIKILSEIRNELTDECMFLVNHRQLENIENEKFCIIINGLNEILSSIEKKEEQS